LTPVFTSTVIGVVGSTFGPGGSSTGPHLHLRFRQHSHSLRGQSPRPSPMDGQQLCDSRAVHAAPKVSSFEKSVSIGFPGRLYTFHTCSTGNTQANLVQGGSTDLLFDTGVSPRTAAATRWLWPGNYTLRIIYSNTSNNEAPVVNWDFWAALPGFIVCAADSTISKPPSPSQTPTPPAGVNPQTCTSSLASFVIDVNYPDYTSISPNQPFTKTWRLQNAGTCTWQGYSLTFTKGEQTKRFVF